MFLFILIIEGFPLFVKLFNRVCIFVKNKVALHLHRWTELPTGDGKVVSKDNPFLHSLGVGNSLKVGPINTLLVKILESKCFLIKKYFQKRSV